VLAIFHLNLHSHPLEQGLAVMTVRIENGCVLDLAAFPRRLRQLGSIPLLRLSSARIPEAHALPDPARLSTARIPQAQVRSGVSRPLHPFGAIAPRGRGRATPAVSPGPRGSGIPRTSPPRISPKPTRILHPTRAGRRAFP
jgi:hypothetical protein